MNQYPKDPKRGWKLCPTSHNSHGKKTRYLHGWTTTSMKPSKSQSPVAASWSSRSGLWMMSFRHQTRDSLFKSTIDQHEVYDNLFPTASRCILIVCLVGQHQHHVPCLHSRFGLWPLGTAWQSLSRQFVCPSRLDVKTIWHNMRRRHVNLSISKELWIET